MKKLIMLFVLGIVLIPSNCFALNEVNVYFFSNNDCNLCDQESAYLDALAKDRYTNMKVFKFDLKDNSAIYSKAKQIYNITNDTLPLTIVGDKVIIGYDNIIKGDIQKYVYDYSNTQYKNELGNYLGYTYNNDIPGKVELYNGNQNYIVEDSVVNVSTKKEDKTDEITWKKYLLSIILIAIGMIMFITYFILRIRERRLDRKEFYE